MPFCCESVCEEFVVEEFVVEEFVVEEFVVGRVAESASNNLPEKYNQIFFTQTSKSPHYQDL